MEYKKLSEIANILNGYAFKSKNYVTNGIRVIRIANVQDGYIVDTSPCFYPQNLDEDIRPYYLQAGDLLISLTGNVGRVGILTDEFLPAALNQRVGCIRIKDAAQVNLKYLFYYFRRSKFTQDCIKASKGVAQLNLSSRWIENYRIPIPSYTEQERIVARIEELFSQLDNSVETLQKAKQQLAVYRQAVLKAAFEGTLTNAEKVAVQPLGLYIEKPRYGTTKKCSYDITDKSMPVYRIPNIDYATGRINHHDIKYADFTAKEIKDITLTENDILMIRSNGSVALVGRAAIVNQCDIMGTFAGYLMRLRIKSQQQLNPKYLLWYLQSYSARIYIENKAKSTSGVHNINSTEISNLYIPVYSYDEQLTIVAAIEARISAWDSIAQTIDTALQQAEALRQSILKKAFEGGLV